MSETMPFRTRPVSRGRAPRPRRRIAVTFHLDERLVSRAREEVGEPELIRSIEAALIAAVDYRRWMREVSAGKRGTTD